MPQIQTTLKGKLYSILWVQNLINIQTTLQWVLTEEHNYNKKFRKKRGEMDHEISKE